MNLILCGVIQNNSGAFLPHPPPPARLRTLFDQRKAWQHTPLKRGSRRAASRTDPAIENFKRALRLLPTLWTAYEGLCELGADIPAGECFGEEPMHTALAASFASARAAGGGAWLAAASAASAASGGSATQFTTP